jgi:hypothetical protein
MTPTRHPTARDAAPRDPVTLARATREAARRFTAAVRRYEAVMPRSLDRLQREMVEFRETARKMRGELQ